jgi:hypothetical protein
MTIKKKNLSNLKNQVPIGYCFVHRGKSLETREYSVLAFYYIYLNRKDNVILRTYVIHF